MQVTWWGDSLAVKIPSDVAQALGPTEGAGCDTLYSEDMHTGLVVDGRLTTINPFA